MKRSYRMTKPTGRKPTQIGALHLKEVPYKDGWIVDITWRGANTKSGRGHKTFNNWRHAEEFAAKENKRIELLKEKGDGRYTLNDAADSYLKERERLSKSKENSGCTRDSFYVTQGVIENHLKPKFGHMRLTQISSRDIKDWLISQGETTKPSTIKTRLGVLRVVLNHAAEHEPPMMVVNPLKVKKVRVPGKISKRAKIPARSDLEVLREFLMGPRPLSHGRFAWSCLRVIVLFTISCGLRVGEMSALTWDDIDPATGEININKARGLKQGLKGPKSEAGNRKIPTTPAARGIINEHAEVYKETYGKCVGFVLRSRRRDYFAPNDISQKFSDAMRECGLVDPGTNQIKFTAHAGRHWCASHWLKSLGDVHQTTKWMGHQNASMTMDIYGHCLDDPEAREKFQRIPDWLSPVVQLDAPLATRPLPAPEDSFEVVSRVEVNGVEPKCPIDVPSIAEPWVKPFIELLRGGMSVPEAYSEIRPQIQYELDWKKSSTHVPWSYVEKRVREEFKRLKLPRPRFLASRFRAERILNLHAQKHQSLDIARAEGCDRTRVDQVLRERHKPNANNPLNRKLKTVNPNPPKSQPEHKIQLKLL